MKPLIVYQNFKNKPHSLMLVCLVRLKTTHVILTLNDYLISLFVSEAGEWGVGIKLTF